MTVIPKKLNSQVLLFIRFFRWIEIYLILLLSVYPKPKWLKLTKTSSSVELNDIKRFYGATICNKSSNESSELKRSI
jgi:hypothetical protein